ncbi:hypothetical protein pb186bvf_005487 [Paramecium bursaria]
MSVLNEFDDLCDFTKVAQRWKQQQTKQSSSPTQSESNISSTNPWNKENSIPSYVEEPKKITNKVRSHAPQIIDEDTEQFKLRLEHLLNVFKTEATSEFMQMKRSMLDDQKQTIKSETERYLQMYEQKTAELAQVKDQLAETLKNNQIQIERVDKITGLLGKFKTKQKNKKLLQQLYSEFKKYSNNRKNKKKNSQRALKHYQLTLQGHIWKLFIKAFNISIRDTIKERAKLQQQTDLDILVMKFQKEQQLLESKLSEMAIQLDEANRVRNGMQENLKRAFMRGVCALNFEAMNVLQGNAQSLDIEQLSNNILTQNNETILLNESNQYQKQQSPIKNITFHAQNRLETNDHKWKDAPLVGYKQVLPVQVDNLKQLQDMSEQNSVVMSVSKLVQQDEDDFDQPVNEGKVIKVQIDAKTSKPKPKTQQPVQQTTKTIPKKK